MFIHSTDCWNSAVSTSYLCRRQSWCHTQVVMEPQHSASLVFLSLPFVIRTWSPYVFVPVTVREYGCWLTLLPSLQWKFISWCLFNFPPSSLLWSELLSLVPKLGGHLKPLSALLVLCKLKLTFPHGLVRLTLPGYDTAGSAPPPDSSRASVRWGGASCIVRD